MYSENHERIAGDVSQDSLENANGGDVRNFACKQEHRDKPDNACNGACDKLGEALAQVVVHNAEIWTRRFQKGVGDKACDSNGGNDGRVFRGVGCAR